MSTRKNSKTVKTVRGYVVDHKTSGARYAVSPQNFDEKIHTKVRELSVDETVRGFRPRRVETASAAVARATNPETPSPEGSQDNTK